VLLYELVDTKPIDPVHPNKGLFPVYRLTVPTSASFHAGRFWYDVYQPVGSTPI